MPNLEDLDNLDSNENTSSLKFKKIGLWDEKYLDIV